AQRHAPRQQKMAARLTTKTVAGEPRATCARGARQHEVARFHSIAAFAAASTSGEALNVLSTIATSASPATGLTSSLERAASSRNTGSFNVATNAARTAATRSAGVPGGMKNGRPIAGTRQR